MRTRKAGLKGWTGKWLALLLSAAAIPAAYLHSAISLGTIFVVAMLYAVPEAVKCVAR